MPVLVKSHVLKWGAAAGVAAAGALALSRSADEPTEDGARGGVASTSARPWWDPTSLASQANSLSVLITATYGVAFDSASGSPFEHRVAAALAAMAEANPALLKHGNVARWFLHQLKVEPIDSERYVAIERAIERTLLKQDSADMLLRHAEAFPVLLDHVKRNEFGGIAGALRNASTKVTLASSPSSSDVNDVLGELLESLQQQNQASALPHLCAWALECWTEMDDTRELMLRGESLDLLSRILERCHVADDATKGLLMRAVAHLLRSLGGPGVPPLEGSLQSALGGLITPIVHTGAHAVANRDEALLSSVLSCLSSLLDLCVLDAGSTQEINSISLLLRHLSDTFFTTADRCGLPLRAALADFIRAATHARDGMGIVVIDLDVWKLRLINWLLDNAKPEGAAYLGAVGGGRPGRVAEGGGSGGRGGIGGGVGVVGGGRGEGLRGELAEDGGAHALYENAFGAVSALVRDASPKGLQTARELLGHYVYRLGAYQEERIKRHNRGGPTIQMSRERVATAQKASLALWQANGNMSPPSTFGSALTLGSKPPTPPEMHAGARTSFLRAYVQAAARVDEAKAEIAVNNAMKALGDLIAEDEPSQAWCIRSGLMVVLRRLVIPQGSPQESERKEGVEGGLDGGDGGESVGVGVGVMAGAGGGAGASSSLEAQLHKHTARVLAILSANDDYKEDIGLSKHCDYNDWMQWLEHAAASSHCKLSSHARRALLNARAKPQAPDGRCLKFLDGLHLLDPHAAHHAALVEGDAGKGGGPGGLRGKRGGDAGPVGGVGGVGKGEDADVAADVVFIHGLQGGPYASWRTKGAERTADITLNQCWPSEWLAREPGMGNVRLLSLGYPTKIFDWEGASVSFREQSGKVMKKLAAAGVGQRPVIFVAHSMGGLVIKEMIMQSSNAERESGSDYDDPRIRDVLSNTKGVVFYSTPHSGSWLADASWATFWYLSLKDTVSVLRPGPYVDGLNDFFKKYCEKQKVSVLSFCEGTATELLDSYKPVSYNAVVVPAESAHPGFGDFVVLEGENHIYVCKPAAKTDLAYAKLVAFVKDVVQRERGGSKDEEEEGA